MKLRSASATVLVWSPLLSSVGAAAFGQGGPESENPARNSADSNDADDEGSADPELDALRNEARREADAAEDANAADSDGLVRDGSEKKPEAAANFFNPSIAVAVNGYGLWNPRGRLGEQEMPGEFNEIGNRFWLREVEVNLSADIDKYARGTVILTAESEGAEGFEFGPEEAFIDLFLEALFGIEGVTIRGGKMRTPIGILNRVHIHDLPHFLPPLAVQQFLGEEGDVREGAFIASTIGFSESVAFTFEAGAFNGEQEILFAAPDEAKDLASHINVTFDIDFGDSGSLLFGGTHMMGVRDPASQSITHFIGTHMQLRLYPGSSRRDLQVVIQAEGFYVPKLDTTYALYGGYALVQAFFDKQFALGFRGDMTEGVAEIDAKDIWAVGFYASWYPTEFMRFRVGYERRELVEDGTVVVVDTIGVQATFYLGSHPPHRYATIK